MEDLPPNDCYLSKRKDLQNNFPPPTSHPIRPEISIWLPDHKYGKSGLKGSVFFLTQEENLFLNPSPLENTVPCVCVWGGGGGGGGGRASVVNNVG